MARKLGPLEPLGVRVMRGQHVTVQVTELGSEGHRWSSCWRDQTWQRMAQSEGLSE